MALESVKTLASTKRGQSFLVEGKIYLDEGVIQVLQVTESPSWKYPVIGRWVMKKDQEVNDSGLVIQGGVNDFEIYYNQNLLFQDQVNVFSIHELFDRITPVLDVHKLSKKRVMVLGVGSVGSRVAIELARSAVGSITLVDPDTLDVVNVVRHEETLEGLGRLKVNVIKEKIKKINPNIQVSIIARGIFEEEMEEFIEQVKKHDLIVVCLGPHEANSIIDSACRVAGVPAVYAGVMRKGYGGTIIWVKHEQTGCYTCVYEALVRRGVLKKAFESVGFKEFSLRDLSEFDQDYGDPNILIAEPAINADIGIIALIQVKISLYLLLESKALNSVGQAIVVILGTKEEGETSGKHKKIISTGHLEKIPKESCTHYDELLDFTIE